MLAAVMAMVWAIGGPRTAEILFGYAWIEPPRLAEQARTGTRRIYLTCLAAMNWRRFVRLPDHQGVAGRSPGSGDLA
jgi:hypothetical protein